MQRCEAMHASRARRHEGSSSHQEGTCRSEQSECVHGNRGHNKVSRRVGKRLKRVARHVRVRYMRELVMYVLPLQIRVISR